MARDEAKASDRQGWSRLPEEDHRTDFAPPKRHSGRRAGAIALWAVGFAALLLGVLAATGGLSVPVLNGLPALSVVLGAVVDGFAVVAAQRLWRGAGQGGGQKRRSPLPGAVASCFAFPLTALYFLAAKNASGRLKGAACASALLGAAAVAACAVVLS